MFEKVGGPVLAVERVPAEQMSSLRHRRHRDVVDLGKGVYRVRDLVEKPPREEAPSNLAIIGRYMLTPDIFPALRRNREDRTGEIQLTNGLRRLLQAAADLRVRSGRRAPRYRQQAGLPESGVYFALRRPDLGEAVPCLPARRKNIERRSN